MAKTLVLHPDLPSDDRAARSAEDRLKEATALTMALNLELVGAEIAPTPRPRPSTLFGPGKVTALTERVSADEIELVIVNAALTPVQQRNLERALKVKVLDRTGLILEIFGDRAQTREGALQVELAHLEYQKSRLVRSWTHLERQRGGVGFMGGPGETQIEADRRMLDERIAQLRRRIEKVVRTRTLHRQRRQRAPQPVVALVGYTNAGKSTLFNRITEAGVLAQDMLFATLDPTMRAVKLPGGREAILSDTVGFIADLPTQLVAAFRATLEEVRSADVIVHVRDMADPETEEQRRDVLQILRDLGLDDLDLDQVLEARNKFDLLDDDARRAELNAAMRDDNAVCLSARTGDGVSELLSAIERRLSATALQFDIELAPQDGAAIAWLYEAGCVRERVDQPNAVLLRVAMSELERGRFEKRFGAVANGGLLSAAE